MIISIWYELTAVEKIQQMFYNICTDSFLDYYISYIIQENFANVRQDNEELKMQMEKLKRKHKTEINTMKQYLTESKLPESALQPLYREDSDVTHNNTTSSYAYDDQAWRAEFGATYQEHY